MTSKTPSDSSPESSGAVTSNSAGKTGRTSSKLSRLSSGYFPSALRRESSATGSVAGRDSRFEKGSSTGSARSTGRNGNSGTRHTSDNRLGSSVSTTSEIP